MSECKPCDFANKFICSLDKEQKCLFYLFAANVVFFVLYLLGLGVLSFSANALLGYIVFSIIKNQTCGSNSKSCDCFEEEKISKSFFNFHDKVNSFIDSVRNVVFLNDIPLLLKSVLTLLFVSYAGHVFSSPATILLSKLKYI